MIRFNNDYNHGALDSILSALTATNADSFAGYGEDIWCQRAETVIKRLVSSRGCPDQIRSRRDPGKSRGHRGGAVPHPERHCRRHRTYQLPRSRFHRKHGAQNPRASQHRRENHRRADRRMCGGVLWRRRAGIPDGAEAGVSVLPHREGDAVLQAGAAKHPGGLPEIRHVSVRGRSENGLRPGGGGQRPDI